MMGRSAAKRQMARRSGVALALAMLWAGSAACAAEGPVPRVYDVEATYEDVRSDLENAIINRGFMIDHVGQLNAMLERTADVVADGLPKGAASPYKSAEYFQFCPVKLTHEAVRASPLAIANCPVSIFVFETAAEPGKIRVGYRFPPATTSNELREVNEKLVGLLDAIAKEAAAK